MKKELPIIELENIKIIDNKNLCSANFNQDFNKNLYVKRSGSYRKLINQDEIEKILCQKGFQIIDTSTMSIHQQILTFANADLIVTPTGAHVTNIIWAKPNTKLIVLASNHPSHQLYLWEILGKVSGSKVSIIYGNLIDGHDHKYRVHDDFYMPKEIIKDLLSLI
jgi:capsular polysaccharide biosynthesis protein